jgi:hypothetical protein
VKTAGAFNISPSGHNQVLKLRLENEKIGCDCLLESGEVTFVESNADTEVKAGSFLYLSSNLAGSAQHHKADPAQPTEP